MFDYITCKMPLPEWPEGKKVTSFQTKSFAYPCMNTYTIHEDGRLTVKSDRYNLKKDDSVTGINYQPLPAKNIPVDFSGMLEFYDYYRHPDYTIQDAYAFEIGHIIYAAAVNSGQVTEIKCVSNVAPRKLSDEELEEKTEKYHVAIAENRKKMIDFRRQHPNATQKLVDEIANIISPKTAISDVSDYMKIINDVQKRISQWRIEHDPWFYHEN